METMEKYDEKKDYPKCVQAYKSGFIIIISIT